MVSLSDCICVPHSQRGQMLSQEMQVLCGCLVGQDLHTPLLKMSDFEVSVEQPAPSHGKHTKELLLELGFEEDDISGFSNANVIKN